MSSSDEATFEVEKIVDRRIYENKVQYKVRWLGYNSDEDSWEDVQNLQCPELLKKFNDELENKNKSSLKKGCRQNIVKFNQPVRIIQNFLFDGKEHVRVQLKDKTYATFSKEFISSHYPNLPIYQ